MEPFPVGEHSILFQIDLLAKTGLTGHTFSSQVVSLFLDSLVLGNLSFRGSGGLEHSKQIKSAKLASAFETVNDGVSG